MKVRDLVAELLTVSEKAATLARRVRAEKSLFELLVQEKTGDEKNKRFVEDFKTLADVLVQETVQHDLGKKFPSLVGHIHGEESNKFTNVLGETVTVEIKPTAEETADLLRVVLDGDSEAATLLAQTVHDDQNGDLQIDFDLSSINLELEIPDGKIGIWIDPIDSTAQYIHGYPSEQHESGVHTRGLQSVLVLIGCYDLTNGAPVVGVVNQPFNRLESDSWRGNRHWGVSYGDISLHSLGGATVPQTGGATLVVSSSEKPEIRASLERDYTLVRASGGGYKLLCVLEGLVSGFALSRSTCFKWDTCAPHAILKAVGGGILDLTKARGSKVKVAECQLTYHRPDEAEAEAGQLWSNSGGVLAYRDFGEALKVLKTLEEGKI